MGQMTRGEIVAEGLELAGNTGLTARANVWLNLWLARVYTQWPWPWLKNHYGPFDVAAQAASLTFGNGAQTADRIHTIRRALLTDPATGAVTNELRLQSSSNVRASDDFAGISASSFGQPQVLHVVPGTAQYSWDLYFAPRSSTARRLVLVAHYVPAFLTADGDVPLYPNDDTMVHAVYAAALRHQQDERWQAEAAELRRLTGSDRAVHGGGADVAGPGLSTTRFGRGSQPRSFWLDR